jgi:hypothetical protein
MRISRLAAVFMLALAAALSFAARLQAAPQSGSVTISPTSFNFGSVTVGGGENSAQFLLTNGTASDITITGVEITPASESYTATTDCPSDLQSQQRCDVYVLFRPVSVGVKNFSLTVSTSVATLTAALTGTGTPSPMVFNPTSLAFGSSVVGVSSTQTSTLTNTSDTGVSVSSIKVFNTNSYTVANNCVPFLDAGASCTVTVTYDPISPGTKNFPITAIDGYGEQTLLLTGTATASPVAVTPSSLSFGTSYVGKASVQSVVIKNVSSTPVTFTSIATTPGKESYTSTNNCPETLKGGATCTVRVTFDPENEGTKNFQLLVTDDVGTQTVALAGTALPSPLILIPGAGVNFGTQPIGYKTSQTVTVKNTFTAPVTISSIGLMPSGAQSYTLNNQCPASLGVGGTCTVTVTFDPVSIGNKYYSLTAVDSIGTQTLPVQGTGAQASLPNLAYSSPVTMGSGGTTPKSLATGDFNGDGKPDFAVANQDTNTIAVFLNKGDGTFAAPVITTVQMSAQNLGTIAAADFNKDGKADLVVSTISGSQADYILISKGDGTFTELPAVPGSFGFISVAIGDLNGDGNLDYVIGGNGTFGYHLGNGDGTFQTLVAIPNVSAPFFGVAIGDFNGDKKPDIATVYPTFAGLGTLLVALGNGDGTFQPYIAQDVDNTYVGAIEAADFNGDGKTDLLFNYPGYAEIGFGDGSGHFGVGTGGYGYGLPVYLNNQSPESDGTISKVADFDRDGLPDVVVGDYALGGLNVVLNAGFGIFPAPVNTSLTLPLAPPLDDIGVADFNGDGVPDIVTCNEQTNQVTVFLSKKPQ